MGSDGGDSAAEATTEATTASSAETTEAAEATEAATDTTMVEETTDQYVARLAATPTWSSGRIRQPRFRSSSRWRRSSPRRKGST
ncbi:MAG: hypothetical protein R2705_10670 [Ilumatobacteraceae bacterium]